MGRAGDADAVDFVATERAGQIAVATQRDLVVDVAVEVAHLSALPVLKHLRMLAVAALSIASCFCFLPPVELCRMISIRRAVNECDDGMRISCE